MRQPSIPETSTHSGTRIESRASPRSNSTNTAGGNRAQGLPMSLPVAFARRGKYSTSGGGAPSPAQGSKSPGMARCGRAAMTSRPQILRAAVRSRHRPPRCFFQEGSQSLCVNDLAALDCLGGVDSEDRSRTLARPVRSQRGRGPASPAALTWAKTPKMPAKMISLGTRDIKLWSNVALLLRRNDLHLALRVRDEPKRNHRIVLGEISASR